MNGADHKMKIPEQKHWAIITTNQIYIPGDERSRTNPGHGYPEHYEQTIKYESYTNFDSFKLAVARAYGAGKTFKIIEATPLSMEINQEIVIKS